MIKFFHLSITSKKNKYKLIQQNLLSLMKEEKERENEFNI